MPSGMSFPMGTSTSRAPAHGNANLTCLKRPVGRACLIKVTASPPHKGDQTMSGLAS